jgi:endoglucanase
MRFRLVSSAITLAVLLLTSTAPYVANVSAAAASSTLTATPAATTVPTTTAIPAQDPVTGKWFVDPYSNARAQVTAWQSSRPSDAAQMEKIASNSQADWFGDWNQDIQVAVSTRISTITAAGAQAVFVAYNIPMRDCGSYSGGGATSPDAYRSWIRAFAAGIGSQGAVVILEPDALPLLSCLNATDQQTRLALINDAVGVLTSNPGTAVYLDIGHSDWLSAQEAASLLGQAGVSGARGFSINGSNFQYTADSLQYGNAIAQLIGGKHFVVDTSRNGLGPTSTNEWCNPSGRGLGSAATTNTGDPLADAFLWLKRPGESDGTCNGGPAAGTWWAAYALGFAQNSVL